MANRRLPKNKRVFQDKLYIFDVGDNIKETDVIEEIFNDLSAVGNCRAIVYDMPDDINFKFKTAAPDVYYEKLYGWLRDFAGQKK